MSLRALSRAPRQVCLAARRQYATNYDQRTKETLKVSSRLTCSSSSPASSPSPASSTSPSPPDHSKSTRPGHQHESAYASDVPKPVEDRHGDSVNKHSIAAHKNQNKVREGKFSGKEFDNHVQTHSPGKPEGDFEKR
ncbi:hypothetical protein CC77DRAFT_1027344 [Alternaria alternata]|uniref:Uncharacterized protein n=1 Tax=Alternaria alternata TaxID=5599 RepID=A0A177E5J7_ALTAL|nr:hypothetical protein CC77DRAFT_1027344 [Alternaria alternata]XP_051583475.1 uncharacterized protein J4E82_010567 [Alternaria postmessia]KAI5368653.1 hypothetical protein J4E82_010567 [Alternaria postmessia]OAG26269.1 hypothetical protein CC77DRAFT_1027344 [Alternaria alternata]